MPGAMHLCEFEFSADSSRYRQLTPFGGANPEETTGWTIRFIDCSLRPSWYQPEDDAVGTPGAQITDMPGNVRDIQPAPGAPSGYSRVSRASRPPRQ